MKLWKLNAVLIILMMGVSLCSTSKGGSQNQNMNNSEMLKLEDMYAENDKFIDNLEKEANIKPENENDIVDKMPKFMEKKEKINDFNENNENFLEILNNFNPQGNKLTDIEFLEKKKTEVMLSKPKSNNKEDEEKNKPIVLKNLDKKKSSKKNNTSIKKVFAKKIKLVMERNPKMIENPRELERYITYSKCQHKTGVLGLVKEASPNQANPSVLIATPIFVALNKNTLSFFSSTKTISLFNNIKLERILKITQRYPGTLCFDIIENEVENLSLLKGPVSLCASTLVQMKQWIDAIEEFKECQVNVNPMLNNKRVLADFQKINTLLTQGLPKQSARTKDLYYDNEKAYIPSAKRVANEIKISNQLKNIIEIIKLGNMAQNSVRRTMVNKLKSAEQFALDVRRKQELIQEIIRKRMRQEKEKETRLITIEHKAKEYKLLKAVEERIKKMKLQELKEYKSIINTRIIETKSKANDEAKKMMRILMDQNRHSNYNDCTTPKLYNFANKDYINDICFRYYGEHAQHFCKEKKEFCNQCCSHHVGIKYATELFKCKSICTKVINGLDKGQVTVKDEKILESNDPELKKKKTSLKKDDFKI